VVLTVPAEPAMSRVARLAASGLASLAGCSLDEIEDIKIAISEALIVLVEHGDGAPITITLTTSPEAFSLLATTDLHETEFHLDHPDLRLSALVLDGVSRDHRIDVTDRTAQIRVTVGRSSG
jgi:hypothetical protein